MRALTNRVQLLRRHSRSLEEFTRGFLVRRTRLDFIDAAEELNELHDLQWIGHRARNGTPIVRDHLCSALDTTPEPDLERYCTRGTTHQSVAVVTRTDRILAA